VSEARWSSRSQCNGGGDQSRGVWLALSSLTAFPGPRGLEIRFGDLPLIDNLDRLSLAIFFIAYLFHPGDGIAIEFFCDGRMLHRVGWRGSVPVLCSCWNPDDVPFSYLLDWASPLLNPTDASCNDECMPEWVSMPYGPGTGFERHARANCARWFNGGRRAAQYARCR